MNIQISADFERTVDFRLLHQKLDKANECILVYVRLYRELAYLHDRTKRLGWISKEHVELVESGIGHEGIVRTLADCDILNQEDDGYTCPSFIEDNEHLRKDKAPFHMRGAYASAFHRKNKKIQQSLGAGDLFSQLNGKEIHDGVVLDHDLAKRVEGLILMVDNAVGRERDRQPDEFGNGMLQDAYRVCTKMRHDVIQGTIEHIFNHRSHPRISGASTEKLLERFEQIPSDVK